MAGNTAAGMPTIRLIQRFVTMTVLSVVVDYFPNQIVKTIAAEGLDRVLDPPQYCWVNFKIAILIRGDLHPTVLDIDSHELIHKLGKIRETPITTPQGENGCSHVKELAN